MSIQYDFDTIRDRRVSECAKWHAYDPDVLPLYVADMDFQSPQPVLEALHERVEHGIFGYPEFGTRNSDLFQCLIDLIVHRMDRLYGWQVEPEAVVISTGVVPGLNTSCTILTGAGDGILMQPPVYPPFLTLARNADAVHQEAPLSRLPDGRYEIDWEVFEAAFTPQTRVFVLCNPHNPVGRVFRTDELERMAEICLAHNVTILSDDIHCDLLFPGQRHIPIASLDPEIARHTLTFMAPSKTYNLAGLHASFTIIQDAELRKTFTRAQGIRSGGVNLLGLVAMEAAFRDGQDWLDQVLAYLKGNRDTVIDFVANELPGVQAASPEGTFLAWLDCRQAGIERDVYHFFLEEARVALNDGKTFGTGGEGFVRLNFGCPKPVLLEALERMRTALL